MADVVANLCVDLTGLRDARERETGTILFLAVSGGEG